MADDIGSLVVKVGVDSSIFEQGVNGINKKISLLKTEFSATSSKLKEFGSDADKLANKADFLGRAMKLQEAKVKELSKAYEKSKTETGENSEATQKLATKLNSAIAQYNKFENELKQTENALKNNVKSIEKNGSALDKLQKQTDGVGDKFSDLGGKIKGSFEIVAASIATVGLTVGASFAGMFKTASSAQKSMNHFQVQTGYSTEEMKKFKDIAYEIYGDNFGEGFEDIADSMAKINQTAALSGKELKDATEEAFLFRDSFGYDIKESIDVVNTLMVNFGLNSKEAYTLMAQGIQSGADKNGDMLDTLKEYAPHFKALGFSADEFTDTLIQGAASGAFQIDKVGDAVKEFSIRSKDGSKTSAEGFKSLGLDAKTMFNTFAKGGPEAQKSFQLVLDKLAAMKNPLEQNQAGVALFGTQFEDLGLEGIKALSDIENYADKTADTLDKINDIQYDDIGSALEGLKRKVVVSLKPVTDVVTNMISDIVNGINSGDWSKVSDSITAGLNEIFSQLGKLAPTFMNIATTILSSLVNGFISSLPAMLPMLANTAIGILTALTTALQTNGPMLIKAAVQAIMILVNGLVATIPKLIPVAVDIILALVNALLDNLPMLIEASIKLILAIVDGLLAAMPKILEAAPMIIQKLIEGLIPAIPLLADACVQIILAIVDFIANNLPLIVEVAVKINLALVAGLIKAIPEVVIAIVKVIDSIQKKFAEIDWWEVGANIIKGIGNGILGGIGYIKDAAFEAANTAYEAAKEKLGIHSPSTVMRDKVGLMIGAGMAEGIKGSTNKVTSAMNILSNKAVDAGSVNVGMNRLNSIDKSKDYTALNNQNTSQQPIFITVISQLDGKEIARTTTPYIDKIQGQKLKLAGRGVGI